VVEVFVTAPVCVDVQATVNVQPTTVLPVAPAVVNLFVFIIISEVDEPTKFCHAPNTTAQAITGLPAIFKEPVSAISQPTVKSSPTIRSSLSVKSSHSIT